MNAITAAALRTCPNEVRRLCSLLPARKQVSRVLEQLIRGGGATYGHGGSLNSSASPMRLMA